LPTSVIFQASFISIAMLLSATNSLYTSYSHGT